MQTQQREKQKRIFQSVMLTRVAMKEAVQMLKKLGIVDYIHAKPTNISPSASPYVK